MVHQTTTDLRNWGPIVNDVRYDDFSFRPGMPIVSELPFGNYIMTYEFVGAEEANLAVYYRISDSPLTFDSKPGMVVRATDGTIPIGSPTNVWTPAGGPLGTIVVSSGDGTEVFLNHDLGAGAWTKYHTPAGASYTRNLMVMRDPSQILITGGGALGGQNNNVLATSIDVTPRGPVRAECNAKDSGH